MIKRSYTFGEIWSAYGKGQSGRFPCPINTPNGEVTHIYAGYGQIRLENIPAPGPIKGKKGFQGKCVASGEYLDKVVIFD